MLAATMLIVLVRKELTVWPMVFVLTVGPMPIVQRPMLGVVILVNSRFVQIIFVSMLALPTVGVLQVKTA